MAIHINALPVEILAKIFSKFEEAHVVCHLRPVCRHFRDVIDENETAIASPYISVHRNRLAARLRYLTDIQHLAPMEAFARHVIAYGLRELYKYNQGGFIDCFTSIYMHPTGHNHSATGVFADWWQARTLFWKCLSWLYCQHPVNRGDFALAYRRDGAERWIREQFTPNVAHMFLGPLQDPAYFSSIVNAARVGLLQSFLGLPQYFLTRKYRCSHPDLNEYLGQWTDICPHVHEVLNLPELVRMGPGLPSANESTKRCLAYCVESAEMAALAKEGEPYNGGVVSPLQWAVVISEIFIW